ncbi:MAG TPA: UTP--glucose-1-phosphate uridylyltransferase [Ilumatobacteraceae bacterium]|nr:UTP--glucose-1-phosphate uridylyltransferase [Ilumatobacteraceae bacterium]
MRARTAVIPAAGLGTRFLPATKAVPKELLPIIDTPALQLIIDECAGAGIDHVVVVTSHAKPAIEAYFADAPEVVARLRDTGRGEMADRLERIGRDVRISFAYQDVAMGLGHAVGCARQAVGDEPFAVLLPDEIMGDSSLLAHMADLSASTGGSVVGLKQVPRDEVHRYGVIDPAGALGNDGVIPIRTMVEKPKNADAPSELIIIGRYVLTPDVFDCIERVQPGSGGEIQLTDALRMQAEAGPFHGVLSDILRYDTGNPFGWLTAVVELALADPAIGAEFAEWLRGRV